MPPFVRAYEFKIFKTKNGLNQNIQFSNPLQKCINKKKKPITPAPSSTSPNSPYKK